MALTFFIFKRSGGDFTQKPAVLIGDTKIFIEIAETSEDKARGLSGRKRLGEHEGMLFVFDNDTLPTFWMKDMLIPLDIIWINDGKIVDIHENVLEPEEGTSDAQLPLYRPETAVDYVLEVNAGFVQKRGIEVGDVVDFSQVKFSQG